MIVPAPGSGSYVAPDAVRRIREAAAHKLEHLEELVSDLALADIPREEVLATVCAVYARHGKNMTGEPPVLTSPPNGQAPKGGNPS